MKFQISNFISKIRAVRNPQSGYSLLELIITMTVLAVLVMGTIPLVQNSIKRRKEQELREVLRMMRSAIDEFKRDTLGACQQGAGSTGSRNPTLPNQSLLSSDPRSRVVVDDCKIFEVDNLDRYPPTLDILVEGVRVKSRFPDIKTEGTSVFDKDDAVTGGSEATKDKKKIYLRELPKDPMTGEKDWKFRSSFQEKDADSWDETNVFDVRSNSDEEALNGEKYSDW
jgi:general secretion pathway protein G